MPMYRPYLVLHVATTCSFRCHKAATLPYDSASNARFGFVSGNLDESLEKVSLTHMSYSLFASLLLPTSVILDLSLPGPGDMVGDPHSRQCLWMAESRVFFICGLGKIDQWPSKDFLLSSQPEDDGE